MKQAIDKSERNIRLIVAYDGSAYHGFQRQDNAITIQQLLEERLATIFGHAVKVTGAARTDTGVHAYGQVVNLTTTGSIPTERIPFAAKSVLPDDIVIRSAAEVPFAFHARFSAKSKIYVYRIYNDPLPDPFLRRYAWHVPQPLDTDAMKQAIRHFVGIHDFSAFRAAGGAPISPIREIIAAHCTDHENKIECVFHGTGFLYHMVRNLTGTLVEVGMQKLESKEMPDILASRDRKRAGVTAPPNGLYLKEIYYE